jgi:hypothetical protein
MKYVECPEEYLGKEKSLFIAGGITGCGNWQKDLVSALNNENLVLINPRRKFYPLDNPNIENEQITWEHNHILRASAVSFWFPNETLCPITLYELGIQNAGKKPMFIGVDPKYARRTDIEIQTRLARPEIKVVYSLESLLGQIKNWSEDKD